MTWPSPDISRRRVLGGLAALAVPGLRTSAEAGVCLATIGDAADVTTDPLELRRATRDWGGTIRRRPTAVTRPGTVGELQEILRWANRTGCPVAVRGAGHSQGGQSLTNGMVIDMRNMNRIERTADGEVDAEGGTRWRAIVDAVAPRGQIPRVLTDYLGLSVGGTLSAGGFGSTSHAYGAQVDNIRELEVVTGRGDVRTCSPEMNRELFDAVRGGVGQYGVITRARIALRPLPARGRLYRLSYGDVNTALRDLGQCVSDGVFHHGWIHLFPGPGHAGEYGSRWSPPRCLLGLAQEGDGPHDDSAKLSALGHDAIVTNVAGMRSEAIGRYEPLPWDRWMAHPWRDWLLPCGRAAETVKKALALLPEDIPPEVQGLRSVAALWVFPADRFTTPAFMIPRTDPYFVGFSFLSRMIATPSAIRSMMSIFDRMDRLIVATGGKAYLSGWTGYDGARWEQHYGPLWAVVRGWKARFDPGAILNPGYIGGLT